LSALKLIYDQLLSNFAINFNLRRYTPVVTVASTRIQCMMPAMQDASGANTNLHSMTYTITLAIGKAVQVDHMKPILKVPETKPLKQKYDKLLSTFAFNFKLRRYTSVINRWLGPISSPTSDRSSLL